MKELFSAFQRELFRPLVTLVLPGMLALFPYLLAIGSIEKLFPFCTVFGGQVIVAISLATLVGMLIEEFGAHIEDGWDQLVGPRHVFDWNWYLRQAPDPEPIAYRYIRSLVLRLKFLLGVYGALLISTPAFAAIASHSHNPLLGYAGISFVLFLMLFCRLEAQVLHTVLGRTRRLLANSSSQDWKPPRQFFRRSREGRMPWTYVVVLSLFFFASALSMRNTSWAGILTAIIPSRAKALWIEAHAASVTLFVTVLFVVAVCWREQNSYIGAHRRLVRSFAYLRRRLFTPAVNMIHFDCLTRGSNSVYIVGSSKQLGAWNPDQGFPLRRFDSDKESSQWFGHIVTRDTSIEFKVVELVNGDFCWEPGSNRTVTCNGEDVVIQITL